MGKWDYWSEVEMPSPKMKPPRHRLWILWRLYGYVFYRPIQKLFHRVLPSVIRSSIRDWLWHSPTGKALVQCPIRYRLHKLLLPLYDCPHCGFDSWMEDELYLEGRDKPAQMLEVVESGATSTPDGTDYWFAGWQHCYQCGVATWHSDGSL